MSINRKNSRIEREVKTIEKMLALYCRHHHAGEALCGDCRELLEYARERLRKCPFQAGKTTCAKCRVHCYKPAMREKIREVMRYSGPRMLSRHPMLAIAHLIDGLRKEPIRKRS